MGLSCWEALDLLAQDMKAPVKRGLHPVKTVPAKGTPLKANSGKRAQVANSGIQEFEVNGITVILKESKKQVISSKLFFKGGTENYGPEVQGVELLALRMLAEASPADMSKDEFNTALESTGTSIFGNAEYDFGTLSLTCIDTYWNDAWRLFAAAVCNPSWDESEFENIKKPNAHRSATSYIRSRYALEK